MAFHKRLANGVFAALVGPGGVEVGEAGAEEHVDHLLGLFDVDDALLALGLGLQLRQAHEAKAEFLDVCAELRLGCVGGHGVLSRLPWARLSTGRVHGKRIARAAGLNQAGESWQTKTSGQLGDKSLLIRPSRLMPPARKDRHMGRSRLGALPAGLLEA